MRLAPFDIGSMRFVHTGDWDASLHDRTRKFLARQADKGLIALKGEHIQWCAVAPEDLQIFFLVLGEAREVHGAWGLLDVEWVDRAQTEFKAHMVPGIPEMIDPNERSGGWKVLRRIADWFLDNPLPLVGGGKIQLVEVTASKSGDVAESAITEALPRKTRGLP